MFKFGEVYLIISAMEVQFMLASKTGKFILSCSQPDAFDTDFCVTFIVWSLFRHFNSIILLFFECLILALFSVHRSFKIVQRIPIQPSLSFPKCQHFTTFALSLSFFLYIQVYVYINIFLNQLRVISAYDALLPLNTSVCIS